MKTKITIINFCHSYPRCAGSPTGRNGQTLVRERLGWCESPKGFGRRICTSLNQVWRDMPGHLGPDNIKFWLTGYHIVSGSLFINNLETLSRIVEKYLTKEAFCAGPGAAVNCYI